MAHRVRIGPIVAAATVGALALAGCSQQPATVPIPSPVVTAATLAPSASPSPTAVSLERFTDQRPKWRDCGAAECTRVTVPLDYADPDGRTIELAVTRIRADGDAPIGSLFVNPGGPGGSAFDYAKSADFIVGEDVRRAYDIIGVDPRGVGKSTPIECMSDAQRDAILELDGTPDDDVDLTRMVAGSRIPAAACRQQDAALAAFMGTANVARDLDVVRAVIGDPAFNYLGKSYGTSIGAVYAQLFPARVGRMVLDGVLPPGADLEEVSLGQAQGFEEALADFARDCSTRRDCPFDGDAGEVEAELTAFLRSLDGKPISGDGRTMNEAIATYTVLSYLYFPPGDYEQLRDGLGALVRDRNPQPMFAMLDARISRGPDGRYQDNSTDSFYAVTCADNPTAVSVDRVGELADQWRVKAPLFGEPLAWGLLVCNGWPRAEAPVTEITADGVAPILVVSTRHDPATPYQWGVELADQLDGSALVTWDAHHHTAYQEGSGCVDGAVDAYLLRGELPKPGLVCE